MDATKYQETYRIASTRMPGCDYGGNGAYFITICTKNRVHSFGEVLNGEVDLTPIGRAAWECWRTIPDHYPFVTLDEFVAMPNHVHGIVIINRERHVPALNQFGPQSENLASIVRGFKIGVTKFARENQIAFAWQPRYHDHIIRDAAEHERIRNYILENPQKWTADCFYESK